MRLGHTFGLTSSLGKAGRGGTYSWVIVDELSAAIHVAFSRPQGESILHILLEVGAIGEKIGTVSNRLKLQCMVSTK